MQTIEPTVTNEEESEALGVPLHSPAFLFERFSRDEGGGIVEFVRSIYRGDRYRLVTELSAARRPAPARHVVGRARRRRPHRLVSQLVKTILAGRSAGIQGNCTQWS